MARFIITPNAAECTLVLIFFLKVPIQKLPKKYALGKNNNTNIAVIIISIN
jgi:hypothetical protein